jgi:hypothetical protein
MIFPLMLILQWRMLKGRNGILADGLRLNAIDANVNWLWGLLACGASGKWGVRIEVAAAGLPLMVWCGVREPCSRFLAKRNASMRKLPDLSGLRKIRR